uniref:Uncharacterized protein n=1 Tax=Astyanax mexicanus TaxID=7994 RepID=A0A8B9JT85_ASTMX
MHHHQEGRTEVVVAGVGAARSFGVAVKVFLIIVPNSLGRYHKHHDAEHENQGQPDASKTCGVFIYSTEEGLEGLPIHWLCFLWMTIWIFPARSHV